MLSNDVVRLHILLDQADSLLAAVGAGDWQGQSGPWRYAATAWQNNFAQVRRGLSTEDIQVAEIQEATRGCTIAE